VVVATLLAAACVSAAPAPVAQTQPSTPPARVTHKKISLEEWRAGRGIHYDVLFAEDTAYFTYGNEEKRKMSLDEFVEFVRTRLSGQTIITIRTPFLAPPPRDETVDDFWAMDMGYYGPDGSFAFVHGLDSKPTLGTWLVARATPDQLRVGASPVLVCWSGAWKDREPAYEPLVIRNGCFPAYDAISLIGGKRSGDVFGMLKGEKLVRPDRPYFFDQFSPPPWPDGQPSVPRKAPHE